MGRTSLIVGICALSAVLLAANAGYAQDSPPYECDDQFGECGTPEQSGGAGCGCGCGTCVGDCTGSILVANTDLGDTYQYADDYDDDGIEDPYDNCVFARNMEQVDLDGDSVGDACDNCVSVGNDAQVDLDGDMIGDLCDRDMDGDDVLNEADNCPENTNPMVSGVQPDTDDDGEGDACDSDDDADGVADLEDNCPLIANPAQELPAETSSCYADQDGDGVPDHADNCPVVANAELADTDGDLLGDECDTDIDGDGILNTADNCALVANVEQVDADRDRRGDACDPSFCYVVYGDEENCLDPQGTFEVYTPSLLARTGETVRLRLFANRENAAMSYTWSIVEAPAGSRAVIDRPYGAVRLSTPYEYHYVQDSTPTLSPDRPGTYTVRVEVRQVWEDSVSGEQGIVSEAFAVIEAEGQPVGGGCSVGARAPVASTVVSVLLGALGLALIRRRSV